MTDEFRAQTKDKVLWRSDVLQLKSMLLWAWVRRLALLLLSCPLLSLGSRVGGSSARANKWVSARAQYSAERFDRAPGGAGVKMEDEVEVSSSGANGAKGVAGAAAKDDAMDVDAV